MQDSSYVSAFKEMWAIEQEEKMLQLSLRGNHRLFFKRGPDCRRYNEPTRSEVAAVFVGEDGAPPGERDIAVYPRDRPP
jgi:hypothetical protein